MRSATRATPSLSLFPGWHGRTRVFRSRSHVPATRIIVDSARQASTCGNGLPAAPDGLGRTAFFAATRRVKSPQHPSPAQAAHTRANQLLVWIPGPGVLALWRLGTRRG